jgi:putative transposase
MFGMSRLPRFDIPGLPLHVIQRGNNRVATFGCTADFRFFKACMKKALNQHACDVHAYVLMTNHVHLLVTPRASGAVSRIMQSIGRRYVEYFNRRNNRSGTLWEGRYRACVIDSDRYLFACATYIEQNPMRAGMVRAPEAYRWSSYRCNALGQADDLVTPHPNFVSLAGADTTWHDGYRALTAPAPSDHVIGRVRRAVHTQWALGEEAFCASVSRRGRRASAHVATRNPIARPSAAAHG